MEGYFLLNDHALAYLIHGQKLSLEYQTEGCWFVLIRYNSGESGFKRYYLKKANGIFESVTNVYAPHITMWGFGWGIKRLLQRRLNINFFNPITQMMHASTPELPDMPNFIVKNPRSRINWTRPKFKQSVMPKLINNDLHVQKNDDHHEFKIQLEPILKKQMNYGNK